MPHTGSIDTLEAWLQSATEDAMTWQLGQDAIESSMAELIPVVYDKKTNQWIEE